MPRNGAYATTGIRPMPINTVYQLLAEGRSAALTAANRMALIPDLLAYWLCGALANERTAASTTGLLDARTGTWAHELIEASGCPLASSATRWRRARCSVRSSPCHGDALRHGDGLQVVATAGHDTAAAFAGASGGRWQRGRPVVGHLVAARSRARHVRC